MLPIIFKLHTLFFGNKDNFVGSFYYSTSKFDRANDEFDRTRRFETSHNCCHQERFQMFMTTPIGATSTNFVVKRDLQNFGSTCGSLWRSFWRYDMKNTQPHLKPKSASSILQALFCRFRRLKLSNPSKLVISIFLEIKDRFICTQCSGAFFEWIFASKARALGSVGNAPDPFSKNSGGDFWTKRNTNKSWMLGTQKQVNYNRKIGGIKALELAGSSLQIWA